MTHKYEQEKVDCGKNHEVVCTNPCQQRVIEHGRHVSTLKRNEQARHHQTQFKHQMNEQADDSERRRK